MRIAIFGGTGGTGREVVRQALEAGHEVSVLVRSQASADTLGSHERLITVLGRLEEPGDVDAVVHGAAAVVSALGATTNGPTTVCADGVRAILQAMRRHGVRRLLVVSAHGVAESHDHSAYVRVVWALRGHRMRDKEVMEDLIAGADIAATVVRVPALSDGPRTGRCLTGTDLRVRVTDSVSRADVADFLLAAAVTSAYVGQHPRIVGRPRLHRRAEPATAPRPVAQAPLTGRVAVVTGATGGMGAMIATDLARRGATVVLAARSDAAGRDLAMRITARTGNPRVEVLTVDLADQTSIRRAVAEFQERHDALHLLVNNAGQHVYERRLSRDGMEMNLAVNHLGWFLLTNLLLDVIRASAPARIVNVASQAIADARTLTMVGRPRPAVLDLDDLQSARDYQPMTAYARAKLAMVMGTYTLARRLQGSRVTVNALHPGLVATNIVRGFGVPRLLLPVLLAATRLFMTTPEMGARAAIHLATDPDLATVNGQYFVDGKPSRSPARSYDHQLQEKLWSLSASLTRLTPVQ